MRLYRTNKASISEDAAKYNNEKYGFVDDAVKGKAKTEKLVYERYIIVKKH